MLARVRGADGAEGAGVTGRFCAAEVAHLLNGAAARELAAGCAPEDLPARLNPRGMTGVVVSALSALDIALADMAARRAGLPLAEHLGGARRSAPVHVTCGFPSLDTDALVRACAAEMEAGAAGVKVLVAARGRSVTEDIARLRAVRGAIGPDADLIADANCGMDPETATAFAEAAEPLGLAWLEEPVRGNDRRALAALARTGAVPLGAGQMEQSAERFELLREAGVSVIQPNAVFAGGIGAAVRAARAARADGAAISPAGGWDGVNLAWMCGAMEEGAVELHRAQARIARLLWPEPLAISGGRIAPPERPGLGLALDEPALAACRIG